MERREQRLREHEVLMREINLGELARPAMQEAAVDYDIRRMKVRLAVLCIAGRGWAGPGWPWRLC